MIEKPRNFVNLWHNYCTIKTTMNRIKTLTITFNNNLAKYEIAKFRGAVIASLDSKDILFHNHKQDNYRYAYPLIQYKSLRGKAAIVCIGEGTEAIGNFFAAGNHDITMGERHETLQVSNVDASNTVVQCWDTALHYHISDWIPLNSDNYRIYAQTEGMVQRLQMLEGILVGNILSFLKTMDIHLEQQLQCSITHLQPRNPVKIKNIKMTCMDVDFATNISLPDNIGLGKHASLGLGTTTRKETKS